MTSRWIPSAGRILTVAALAAGCWYVRLAPVGAHELRRGQLVFPSGSPVTGQVADIEVVILGADDRPAPLLDTQVFITADMTAHAMTPIATELTTVVSQRKRAGKIGFSMAGQWRITLSIVEPDEDERVAVLPVRVLPPDATPLPTPLTINFGLDVPLRPTVFDPWLVVSTSVGLIAVLETLAIVRSRRRRRQLGTAVVNHFL